VSYSNHDSAMVSPLIAASTLSWIRRTLTPTEAASLDAVLAAAVSARQTGLTGKWIDKIDRHCYDRPSPPSTHGETSAIWPGLEN
jgi:hypothetical protein